jgi:hypothetical protein
MDFFQICDATFWFGGDMYGRRRTDSASNAPFEIALAAIFVMCLLMWWVL